MQRAYQLRCGHRAVDWNGDGDHATVGAIARCGFCQRGEVVVWTVDEGYGHVDDRPAAILLRHAVDEYGLTGVVRVLFALEGSEAMSVALSAATAECAG